MDVVDHIEFVLHKVGVRIDFLPGIAGQLSALDVVRRPVVVVARGPRWAVAGGAFV